MSSTKVKTDFSQLLSSSETSSGRLMSDNNELERATYVDTSNEVYSDRDKVNYMSSSVQTVTTFDLSSVPIMTAPAIIDRDEDSLKLYNSLQTPVMHIYCIDNKSLIYRHDIVLCRILTIKLGYQRYQSIRVMSQVRLWLSIP